MTASDIAEKIGASLVGNARLEVTGVASPQGATQHDIVVLFSRTARPEPTDARVAVVPRECSHPTAETILQVEEPRAALAVLTELFPADAPAPVGVHPTACVAADAKVDAGATIGPHCIIESGACIGAGTILKANVFIGARARIGASCTLHPGVAVYPRTVVGDRVTVHANSTLGLDGFSFVTEQPDHPKVHSLGWLIVEDDVEIGSGTGIQRGTLDFTRIGRGTKLGSQIEIGHNCILGEYCLLVGKIGIAGSVTLGNRVFIGAGAFVRDHVTVGDDVRIMMCSVVTRNIPAGAAVLGFPAQNHELEKARYLALTRLAAEADRLLERGEAD